MTEPELHIPITEHPNLPDGVPLVASFHDDRNRLSYYYPLLDHIDGVRTPATAFFHVTGNSESFFTAEYREITRFMQDIDTTEAFVRSDFSSGKYEGETGSKITSQDPFDIETTVTDLFKQLCQSQRWIGSRIAVREWIPHDAEIRYFIRDGDILYRHSYDTVDSFEEPDEMSRAAAERFDTFSWSFDLIHHSDTGDWYAIDMGLDGLYPTDGGWIAISEHPDSDHSPQQYADDMPGPMQFQYSP